MVNEPIYIHYYDNIDVDNLGNGVLSDAISCTVTEELGGLYELEMEYPYNGRNAEYIALNSVIIVKTNAYDSGYASKQPFRVYEISKPINKIITIKAEHIRYDLRGITVPPLSFEEGVSLQYFTEYIKTNSSPAFTGNFIIDSRIQNKIGKPIVTNTPVSMLSLMGGEDTSIPNTYGVELIFDQKDIRIVETRGSHRDGNQDISVIYGKNMTDFTAEEKADNLYTHVYPYFYYESDEEGHLYEIPEKVIATGLTGVNTSWYLLDLSSSWVNDRYNWRDEYPTIEEMTEVTNDFIAENNMSSPVVSITCSFIDDSVIKKYSSYGWEHLKNGALGDYVDILFRDYGVNSSLRIVKTIYNVLTCKYDSVELGSLSSDLSSNISSSQMSSSDYSNALATAIRTEHTDSLKTRNLEAKVANISSLTAESAIIVNIAAEAIKTDEFKAGIADIDYLTADSAIIENISAVALSADNIEAAVADIGYITARQADLAYASINFANVDTADINVGILNQFFSRSGYVQHQTIGEEDVQYLRGVKIVGDIVEANTISAKSIILRNETEGGDYKDGLIWSINAASGDLTQQQLTEEKYRQKLDGSDIVANSITANQITANNIQGSYGWINLAQGTFNYGGKLSWDGTTLNVDAENINIMLNKKNNAKFVTFLGSGSLENIKLWVKKTSDTYSISESVSTLDQNDLVYIKTYCTTLSDYVYIKGQVISINSSSNSITITPYGFEPMTPVATPIAYINASAEDSSITISGSRINIQGNTTFSNLKTKIDNWSNTTDTTQIDGGKIYTNTIKARSIDIDNLFARTIAMPSDGVITWTNSDGSGSYDSETTTGSLMTLTNGLLSGTSNPSGAYGTASLEFSYSHLMMNKVVSAGKTYADIIPGRIRAWNNYGGSSWITPTNIYEAGTKLSEKYLSRSLISFVTNNVSGSVSVAKQTVTPIASISLSPGVYILYGTCRVPSQSSVFMGRLMFSNAGGTTDSYSRYTQTAQLCGNGQITHLQVMCMIHITSTATWYLKFVHNYSSNVTLTSGTIGINGIRLIDE